MRTRQNHRTNGGFALLVFDGCSVKNAKSTHKIMSVKKIESAENTLFSALFGTLKRTLTSDLPLRRRPLYTTELSGHIS